MDSLNEFLDRALAMLFGSATIYGAGGALLNARRKGKSPAQTVSEVLGGALTANIVMPLVQEYAPEKFHYTLFFLVGWGGLELVGRLYEAFAQALEDRIKRRINQRERSAHNDHGEE